MGEMMEYGHVGMEGSEVENSWPAREHSRAWPTHVCYPHIIIRLLSD